ncbi:signal peptide plus transmembrane domain or GPI anchor [Cryptosporidium ryanae]|uniref:signal peptide plus transmembrane domain or GPI anchor n=1 Tax=Cryptosporidium ryanae TaxID=515981 RepID=UPI00351A5ED9|nr:signal peptide plus transmembrane domain or GPI anchor [Cryptosporidium ryanae]
MNFVHFIFFLLTFYTVFNENNLTLVNGYGIVGIDLIYTVVGTSVGNLFVLENGRVFIFNNNEVLGKLDEFSPKDRVVNFKKLDELSYIMLVKRFEIDYLVLTSIDISDGSILKRWDLNIEASKVDAFIELFITKEKYYLPLNNNLFVIQRSVGLLLENETIVMNGSKLPISIIFGNDEIIKSIVVFDQSSKNVILYDFNRETGKLNTDPKHTISLERNFSIYLNSCLITKNDQSEFLNILYLDKSKNEFGLLEYNFKNGNKKYINTNLNTSSLSNKQISILDNEITLRQIRNSDIIITFSRYDTSPSKHVIYIFEQEESFVLKSFKPVFNDFQSSLLNIFIDENSKTNKMDYLLILNYSDNNNYLSITNIFGYKKPITENKMFRNTLKLDYFVKEESINHGPIEYSSLTSKGDLILQWEDSLLLIISLNCDIVENNCGKPEIIDIYESFTSSLDNSEYYENHFIVYTTDNNKESKKSDFLYNLESSIVVSARNIYYDSMSNEPISHESDLSGTMLITVNKYYSILCYHIERKKLIWRNDTIKRYIKDSVQVTGIRQFIVGDKKRPMLLLVVNELFIFKINITSGITLINALKLEPSSKILLTSLFDSTGDPLIDPRFILIDESDNLINILDLNNFDFQGDKIMSKDLVHHYITYKENKINCYVVNSTLNSSLKWRYSFKDEKIENIATPKCHNCINSPSIVSKDYKIINKFDYPAILGITTNKNKLMIFNSINGNLLHSEILPKSFISPFTLGIYHNVIVLTAFHAHHQVPVFHLLELYQFPSENKITDSSLIEKLKFLISSDKNLNESKINPERKIHIQQITFLYKYELPITTLTLSKTLKSIAPKMILFGNENSNIIEAIPEKLFTTLRPNSNKYFSNNLIENMDYPLYKSIVDQRVKFTMKFSGPKKIIVLPDKKFESTSILISIGFNYIEIKEFYPGTPFDRLPEDFNKTNIVITVLALVIATALALNHLKKKNHKKWE